MARWIMVRPPEREITSRGRDPHDNTVCCRYCMELDQVKGVERVRVDLVTGVGTTGEEENMSLWWIPTGVAAWFLIAAAAAMYIGPLLGRCSQARADADRQWTKAPDARSSAWTDQQAAPAWPGLSSDIARR